MHGCDSPTELRPVDATVELLLQQARPLTATETLPLSQALGRVLATELVARVDVPGHDNSAMDGYALRLADLPADRRLPVAGLIPAGSAPVALASGAAARIFTGAPVPAGADAVVMQEQCERQGEWVRLPEGIAPGQNIRRAGEDVRRGQTILAAGQRLPPQALGLAAAVGHGQLPVLRRLRVALLSTGDELAAAGTELRPGQIYDSNGPTLTALCQRLGFEVLPPRRLPDDLAATIAALREAAAAADVILTTGGVSVGDEDHVRPAVEALGRLDLWRVAIKPGKPFAFGYVGDTPLLGLPGNPVSVFITFLMLARPFLLRCQGLGGAPWPPAVPVQAGFDWPRPDRRRREYLRARLLHRDGALAAELYPHQGSGVLSSCAWADGLIVLQPGQTVRAGETVPYLSLAELLG